MFFGSICLIYSVISFGWASQFKVSVLITMPFQTMQHGWAVCCWVPHADKILSRLGQKINYKKTNIQWVMLVGLFFFCNAHNGLLPICKHCDMTASTPPSIPSLQVLQGKKVPPAVYFCIPRLCVLAFLRRKLLHKCEGNHCSFDQTNTGGKGRINGKRSNALTSSADGTPFMGFEIRQFM